MNLLRPALLLPVAALALAACDDDPSGPETQVELAAIGGFAEPDVTVSLDDEELFVRIVTYGNPCTSRHHDDVDVDRTAREIVVRPYNEVELTTCFMSLEEIPHELRVDIDESGEWLVRVIGVGMDGVDPGAPQADTIVVERSIAVDILIENPNQ